MRAPAKKSLGQNFLIDPHYQRRIVDALAPGAGDAVVEIGPGHGALTGHLLGRVRRLVLVELDRAIAARWAQELAGRTDAELRHQDALSLDLAALGEPLEQLKVIGNIPYNITSPLIFHLLERGRRAALIVLMVQREVADRILAEPGGRSYGALSVGVRALADVERLFQVPRGAFRPVPGVDSSVIRLRPHRPERLGAEEERDLRMLTRTTFGWRRKQLQRILREAVPYRLQAEELQRLEARGFALAARPETIPPAGFVELARELRQLGRPLPEHGDAGSWE